MSTNPIKSKWKLPPICKASKYILCYPDLDWQEDPLREHPNFEDRLNIYEMHKELIEQEKTDYCIIKGPQEDRVNQALKYLQKV